MEQIRTYPCLYDESKMSCKEVALTEMHGVKLQKSWISYKTVYANLDMKTCCPSLVTKNRRVRASLSAAEIHFPKSVSFFEMN